MQTKMGLKTKGVSWGKWAPVLSMVLGTAVVYLLTARWPADDYRDRLRQLFEVLAVFVVTPFALAAFVRAKLWPPRRR